MSYFIIVNNNELNNKKEKNINKIDFDDLYNYMIFLNKNYTILSNNNDVNELLEIFSQLNISKDKVFFDLKIDTTINDYFKTECKLFDTIVTNNFNYNIDNTHNLIFRVDNLLDCKTLEYIYNLLLIYKEIVIYNCFITNLNSFRFYIVCSKQKDKKVYLNINKLSYIFKISIKNIYYQIIQNRFNSIKKEIIQEEHIELWKKMYLHH